MGKNSHIHIMVETNLKDKIKAIASEKGVSMAQLCRYRILNYKANEKMEHLLEKLIKKIDNCPK
jgi:hypothetical protein